MSDESIPMTLSVWRRTLNSIDTPESLLRAIRAAIEAREPEVQAWEVLDWSETARQCATLMSQVGWRDLPLAGVPVGVKDIFDTAGFVTSYGSTIYAGHQPSTDSAAVAQLRAAGAIVPGKTVTTEFAFWRAGKTRNPHDLTRSPGGSSAGSAAAVASGMVPLAIGSQTAASTIRPAAYCGITGFKPSRGRISLAGVKALAGSLDNAGCFAASIADVAQLAAVLAARRDWARPVMPRRAPALRIATAPEWDGAEGWMCAHVTATGTRLQEAGATLETGSVPTAFSDLAQVQTRIMAAEAARDLAPEVLMNRDLISETLRAFLDEGAAISPMDQDADYARRDAALAQIDTLFGGADILLAPSALDEAPEFSSGTGSPDLSRTWTLLGLPSVSLPSGSGPSGLPVGVQLAARPGADLALLEAALWIEARLDPMAPVGGHGLD